MLQRVLSHVRNRYIPNRRLRIPINQAQKNPRQLVLEFCHSPTMILKSKKKEKKSVIKHSLKEKKKKILPMFCPSHLLQSTSKMLHSNIKNKTLRHLVKHQIAGKYLRKLPSEIPAVYGSCPWVWWVKQQTQDSVMHHRLKILSLLIHHKYHCV